ncbi:MAG TPA: phage tail tip lysozyme [Candidatus Saccharimonadales bacterium]
MKQLTFRKLLSACALLVIAVLSCNQVAFALSPAQKQIYEKGIYQFDIETGEEVCGTQAAFSLTGNSNAAKAFNFLTGQGLSDFQAAGVVGNLQAESSIMPNRKQGSGIQTITSIDQVVPDVGFGIAQWTTAGRQAAWKNLAKEKNMDPLSLELQLLYLWHELESDPDFFGLDHLTRAKDLKQATWIFLAFFERPGTVVDAGKAGDPLQPSSGAALQTLNDRVELAKKVTGGTGGAASTATDDVSASASCGGLNGTTARIGTFNIFHIDDGESKDSWMARLKRSADVITTNNLDIVGLQETRPDQQREITGPEVLGSNYGIYPKRANDDSFTPNPVVYDKSRWEVVEDKSERFKILYGGGDQTLNHGLQVRFKEAGCAESCTEIYVLNTHDPAGVRGGTPSIRSANSNTYVERMKQLQKDNIPIFLTGDFNSEYKEGAHCIISKSGIVKDTWETFKNIEGCAEGREEGTAIDRIYASPDVLISKYWSAPKGKKDGNGSDVHATIMNEVKIGGESDGVFSANGYTFPLKVSRETILNEKPTPWCSGNTNNCHHDYNASDIFAPTGTPVVATRGGQVVSAKDTATSPSSVGTRVTIKGDDGWLYYYAHMGSRTLEVREGQKIKAGDPIGKVGTSENAVGTDPHLHIDRLPAKQYSYRPSCSGAACSGYPFDNIQRLMSEIFKVVK